MLRIIRSLSLALAALAASAATAAAQERFALVIGNSQYKGPAPLLNPARDAKAVGALLQEAGFEVISALDLDKAGMSMAIRAFTSRMAEKPEKTVTLIYFAGHGVQVEGENYLIPVDAAIARESDVPLESLRVGDMMNMLERVRSKTRIVFLDACRNNPFADIAKTAPRGLALVNAPAGTLIAYSTSPGTTADDGTGSNSPFAAALLKSAREPGLAIETMLKSVRLSVHGATTGRQTPWEVSALTEPFSFFPGSGPLKRDSSASKNAESWRKELQAMKPATAFDVALREDNIVVYQQYIALFENDPLATRVRSLLDRRQMMVAWLEAVTLNSPSGFAAFLARYPDSDLAATAKRMEERAKARSSFARSFTPVLGLTANALSNQPEIRTIVREVKVPEVRTVIQEVKVPSPPEIRTVVKEVVREVKVPSAPEIRTVTKEVVKVVNVPGPACSCSGPGPRINIRSAPPPRVHIRAAPPPRIHGPRIHSGGRGIVRVGGPRIRIVGGGGHRGPRIHSAGPRPHGGGGRGKFRF
jgi:hypothetical protein